jgi:hypothetical protein
MKSARLWVKFHDKNGKITKLLQNRPHEGKERIEGGSFCTFRGGIAGSNSLPVRWSSAEIKKKAESANTTQWSILTIATPYLRRNLFHHIS